MTDRCGLQMRVLHRVAGPLAVGTALTVGPAGPVEGAGAVATQAGASGAGPDAAAAPGEWGEPRWRFRQDDRPVKVVSLGGSIAARRREGYVARLARVCRKVEIKNLAKTGLGAWALKRRFLEQVVRNRRLRFDEEGVSYWLLLGGTLNSVGTPRRHNYHTMRLIEIAHRRGFSVVALTPTPWGDDRDRRFRRAPEALKYHRNTRAIVDFLIGRSDPTEALGPYARRRAGGADAPWRPEEKPDVVVNLFDGPLRYADAPLRDREVVRSELAGGPGSRQRPAVGREETAPQRGGAIEAAMRVGRWYLRPEYRGFDHIHPNAEGHAVMASEVCPHLPPSWGCACDELPAPSAATGGAGDAAFEASGDGARSHRHWEEAPEGTPSDAGPTGRDRT